MLPVEDTLDVEDLLRWIPLSGIDVNVLSLGAREGYVDSSDILRVVRLRQDAGLVLSSFETAVVERYYELDAIDVLDAIHEAAGSGEYSEADSRAKWFYAGAARLAAHWPGDEDGIVLAAMLIDHFLKGDDLPDLLYYTPRPFWSRRSSAREQACKFQNYVAELRGRGKVL